jgi:hypothetical protein
MTEDHDAVLAAATRLVACFGSHKRDEYFACFAPDASFVFHSSPTILRSRRAYEAQWERWEQDDGFRVVSCASTGGDVLMIGPAAAVFTHSVETVVRTREGEATLHERESIIFAKVGKRWLAVHEHLSPSE